MRETSNLLINEPSRIVSPTLACLIGESEAMLLQQIHFLLGLSKKDKRKFKEGRWWTYDTFSDLRQVYFPWCSERKIQRDVAALVKRKLLVIGHFANHPRDRTNWYSIDYEKLDILIQDNGKEESPLDQDDLLNNDETRQNDEIEPTTTKCHDASRQNEAIEPTTTKRRDAPRQNDVMSSRQSCEMLTIDKDLNTKISNTLPPSAAGSVQDNGSNRSGDSSEEVVIEEISYGDVDENGIEISQYTSQSLRNPKWRQPIKSNLCKKAFRATRRKYFKNKGERTSWLKAEKAMLPLDTYGKVRYPTEWVKAMIEWARSTNIEHQTAHATRSIKIPFPALLTAIHNEEARNDWVTRELHIRRTTGTGEDDPNPWADPGGEDLLDENEQGGVWLAEERVKL